MAFQVKGIALGRGELLSKGVSCKTNRNKKIEVQKIFRNFSQLKRVRKFLLKEAWFENFLHLITLKKPELKVSIEF